MAADLYKHGASARWLSRALDTLQEHGELALAISVGSLVFFVGSLLLMPWLVARAPEDYFVTLPRERRSLPWTVLRNVLGALLVVAGALMLVLPGQGLLTILLGMSALDFPGKQRLIHRLAQRPSIKRSLQWLRRRAGRPPFILPEP